MRAFRWFWLGGLFLLAACGKPASLTVGFVSGQTGAFSDLGAAGVNGAILAVEQRNAQGGVAGIPVRLVIRDDQHDPQMARAAMQSLIDQNAVAVVGPMTSAMAVEMVPLANASETVLMGGTVVTNRLTGKDDFFLRPIAPAKAYAAYSAGVHWQRLKPARVSVVYDLANRDYAEDWAESYAVSLAAQGKTEVRRIPFDSRAAPRLDDLVARILEDHPELVACACSARSAAEFMRQIRNRGLTVQFAVSAWAANQMLIDHAGGAAEGAWVEQYHNLGDTSAKYRNFVEAYQKRFGFTPDYAAVVAYDATNIVLDGLAEDPGQKGLRAVLLKQKRFAGVQGDLVFDSFGDAARQGYTTRIEQGKFVPLLPEGQP